MILEDYKKVLKILSLDWNKQNDLQDRKTKFIYDVEDYNTLMLLCNTTLKTEEDKQYAYHRWINYNLSTYCEELFCKYGARRAENRKDKDKDIYIKDVPFDVKITNYPRTISKEYDIDKLEDKIGLAKWMYANQSREGRDNTQNRIFIIFYGDNQEEKNKAKIDLEQIEEKIKQFMTEKVPNKIVILDDFKPSIYAGFVRVNFKHLF